MRRRPFISPQVRVAFTELSRDVPRLWTADSDGWIHPTSWVGMHKLIVGALDLVSIPVVAVMLGGTLGVKSLPSPDFEHFDISPNAKGQSFWAQPIVARTLLQ
jgi:hypothetical protein